MTRTPPNSQPVLRLPDIHEKWPFPVAHNRWEELVSTESLAWIESLGILSAVEMKKFKDVHFDIFASMAYAYFTDVRHFRVACDVVQQLFLLDDLTDEMSAPEARCVAAVSMDGLRNWKVPRPQGEHPVGEMLRSCSERLHAVASQYILDRFIHNYELYLNAVVDEAGDRDHKTMRSSLDSYLTMRRETGAVKVCFDLLLIPHNIPNHILEDNRIIRVETLANDIICVGNARPSDRDILSFNREQARGDVHNAVIVVMQERGLSIQEAMDFIGAWYRKSVEDFCVAMRDLPPCGSVSIRNQVKDYIAGIANWITSNYEWSLRSGRYFPPGEDPMESGWIIPLMPKKHQ
ncbi:isoprenoid synthase domain-containing protein [Mycena polygramma]|nr:isoprenoid synthase domain-containing protein [Mycena polygramma]